MDLELHIVHVDKTGTPAAVIGFLFSASNDTDAYNAALD
jgi:carbonic anhydrase